MPAYKITGIGRETNRKRVRVYETDDKEAAFERAFTDGTIVDVAATKIVRGKPPTEKQLRLVKELKLCPLKKISKRDLSKFLDKALKNDIIRKRYCSLPPTGAQLQFAKELGIKKLEGITRGKISDLLDKAMKKRDNDIFGIREI